MKIGFGRVVGLVRVRVLEELVGDVYRASRRVLRGGGGRRRAYTLVITVERGRSMPYCTLKRRYINLPMVREVNPSCMFKVKCINCPNFIWEKRLTVFV